MAVAVVLPAVVLLLMEDVVAAGLIPGPAHVSRPRHKDAITYQPQAAAADFIGTLARALAAQRERPQLAAEEQAGGHPAVIRQAEAAQADGMTTEVAVAKPAALLQHPDLPLQQEVQPPHHPPAHVHQDSTGCLTAAAGACPMAVPQLQLLLLPLRLLPQLQRQLNQLNRLQLHLQLNRLQPPAPDLLTRRLFRHKIQRLWVTQKR